MNLNPNFNWFKVVLLNSFHLPHLYIFRGITIKELRRAAGFSTGTEAQDFILQTCVMNGDLTPVDLSIMLGGCSEFLLQQIYTLTGLTEDLTPWKEANNWSKTEDGMMEMGALMTNIADLNYLDNADPLDRAKTLTTSNYAFMATIGKGRDPIQFFQELFELKPVDQTFESNNIPITPPEPGQGPQRVQDSSFSWRKR